MTWTRRKAVLALVLATAASGPAFGQDAPQAPRETRPATTTFLGDTGLWFVPTAEILPDRGFSASAYRVNLDRQAGSTDISNFPITFGVGLKDRFELFGAFTVNTRIDRDERPLYQAGTETGGLVVDYPLVRKGWSSAVGDLWVGGKFNLMAPWRQQPAAVALRAAIKLPTGADDEGVSSGDVDFLFDAVVSKEVNERVELSGYGGLMTRGGPDGIDGTDGFRWGFGAGIPTRTNLRLTAELFGEAYFDDTITSTLTGTDARAEDGSFVPAESPLSSPVQLAIGATYLSPKGFFAGAGIMFNFNQSGVGSGSKTGLQIRVGYHPGVRIYVPPPPPGPPAPPPAQANQPPTVKARCEPCTIEVGKTASVTADAQDPDGDTLTYRWSAPTGKLANPGDRQTTFTAPMQEGPVQLTVTVDDGKGGTASATVTIQVVAPPKKEYVFEDVHFDFDRYTLRPEALRVLDEAIKAMQEDTTLRLTLEGHTCNIGTAEYNLALGERRANAVRDYLTSRGIGMDRLRTVSFGEERPKHDNLREETRRLNRRAALVVRLQ